MRNFETAQLEATLEGKQPPMHGLEATLGRLAQLYLQDPISPGDPARALALVDGALGMLHGNHPVLPKLLHVKAMALRLVATPPDGALGLQGTAAALDRDAWLLSLDRVTQEALLFACEWGDWAWSRRLFEEASQAYDGASVAVARLVLSEAHGLDERLNLLASFSRLGPRGAYAYASINNGEAAVLILARTAHLLVGWGEQTRALQELKSYGHRELYDRTMSSILSAAGTTMARDEYGRLTPASAEALQAVNEAVAEIRTLPGWSQFAAPSSWRDIEEAAQSVSLAYVATTDQGTIVCVVTEGGSRIASTLLEATIDEVVRVAMPFVEVALANEEAGDPRDALIDLIQWLGLSIMGPVFRDAEADKQVTLVPLGVLALLPLHAGMSELPPVPGSSVPRRCLSSKITYDCSARMKAEAGTQPTRPVTRPWLSPIPRLCLRRSIHSCSRGSRLMRSGGTSTSSS